MSEKKSNAWSNSTGLARAILHDRQERRKWLAWMAVVPLAMIALGLWGIKAWVWEDLWRALFWWSGCALATFIVLLFALYDACAVIREERTKNRSDLGDL